MVEPTPAQKDLLGSFERAAYNLADFWNKHMRWQSALYNNTVMMGVTWLTVARRVHVTGLEHAKAIDMERGILLVANHRTFFDYFTIMSVLVGKANREYHRNIMFPVRSTFFYDGPLGCFVNLAMSGFAMFPPIMREREKRPWNDYAIQRCIAELENNAVKVGIHPEGRRYPDAPPFSVQRGKLGTGHIALGAENCQILPVFMTGITNNLFEETLRNWLEPERYPVFIAFGPDVDLSDLRQKTNDADTERQAVDRCMDAVAELADVCRRMAGFKDKETAEA